VAEYLHAFDRVVVPALRAFAPALVLVSAGYDAHRDDPLAQMRLDAQSYAQLAARLRGLDRPLVALLEGGYDLDGVATSSAATLEILLGQRPPDQSSDRTAPGARAACERTIAALAGTPLHGALL
jgi:acetoin utilization deacetylase AcuC-like enzyme